MKQWLQEYVRQITGYYAGSVVDCKSYAVIRYMQETDYKGMFYAKKNRRRRGEGK